MRYVGIVSNYGGVGAFGVAGEVVVVAGYVGICVIYVFGVVFFVGAVFA